LLSNRFGDLFNDVVDVLLSSRELLQVTWALPTLWLLVGVIGPSCGGDVVLWVSDVAIRKSFVLISVNVGIKRNLSSPDMDSSRSPSAATSLATPSMLRHTSIWARANVVLWNAKWAIIHATSEGFVTVWERTEFALSALSIFLEILCIITSILHARLRGLIRISVFWAFVASSVPELEFSSFISIITWIVDALILLRSRISEIRAGKAISSDCPNISISIGHIALDAVLTILIWVEVFITILTGTVNLQDLVLNATVWEAGSVVLTWFSERTAVFAVTRISLDLSQKVALVRDALSAVVVRSLVGLTLLAPSVFFQDALFAANIKDAFFLVVVWISERHALLALAVNTNNAVRLARFLDTFSLSFGIRSIVLWALCACTILFFL